MDLLFKTIAYGLNVDVREAYKLNVREVAVSYDELQMELNVQEVAKSNDEPQNEFIMKEVTESNDEPENKSPKSTKQNKFETKWAYVNVKRLNRLVFDVDIDGLDTNINNMSGIVQTRSIGEVLDRSPDIQINNFKPLKLHVLNECLFKR